MTYRISDIEISDDEPFAHDVLGRRPVVEFLEQLIKEIGGPFVMALDSPWGSGKTTLVRMLMVHLKRQNFQCIYFNAWKVDYVVDPLVALVSSIDQLKLDNDHIGVHAAHMKKIRKITSIVARRALSTAVKVVTLNALDTDEVAKNLAAELTAGATGDVVQALQKESELLTTFRDELSRAVGQLGAAGKRSRLIIFIDELDRCRPSFAIEMLERIKHLFDIENIIFVLSVDKKQLMASTAAVYGANINAEEYLRRFIDLEYNIPVDRDSRSFTEALLERFDLDSVFKARGQTGEDEKRAFVSFFTALANDAGLSLRARERCLTRLRAVLAQTPNDEAAEMALVLLFIVIRAIDVELFQGLVRGVASADEVAEFLGKLSGGQTFVNGRGGSYAYAFMVMCDSDRERANRLKQKLLDQARPESADSEGKARATLILEMIDNLVAAGRGNARWADVLAKVDIAAMIEGERAQPAE